ncbi:MAG: hypothetical protein R3E89_00545 [Thiolinea sp.]
MNTTMLLSLLIKVHDPRQTFRVGNLHVIRIIDPQQLQQGFQFGLVKFRQVGINFSFHLLNNVSWEITTRILLQLLGNLLIGFARIIKTQHFQQLVAVRRFAAGIDLGVRQVFVAVDGVRGGIQGILVTGLGQQQALGRSVAQVRQAGESGSGH